MRKSWKDKGLRKVCIPIVETTVGKAFGAIEKANRVADLIELRLDYLKKVELERLFNRVEKPFIVTNRGGEEGGRYKGDERKRLNILMEAIDLEAHYVDVEMKSEPSLLQSLIRNKRRTKLILSFHDFQKTPPLNELQNLFDSMIQMGADIVKIVTFANSWEDNLQTLSLIPYGKEKGREIVAFCMGEKGKISRIFAPSLGAAWTYASLNNAKTSAPGQLTVQEMNHIWERLR
jgi:3-dehydroquinate dehydratase type I